jgi:Asp/Glu/hydantoin racemase
MQKKVAFLHTVPSLLNQFNRLSQKIFPSGVEVFHIVDEMLLKVVLAQGGLSPFIHRRVAEHALAVETAGADLFQVTCSSLSPCVDSAMQLVNIPVLKIDTPMIDRAIQLGHVIGIVATAPTTLKPTTEQVLARAAQNDLEVAVDPVLCEAAYKALFAGDQQAHDLLLREAILDLSMRTDVIILAQASMARVLDTIDPFELEVPVLTSPELALEHVLEVLGLNPQGALPAADQ